MKEWLINYYKGAAIGCLVGLLMGPIYYGAIWVINKIGK